MLPSENPPDRSCSFKVPALTSDEEASGDRVVPLEADPSGLAENQTPHFSIRDYAFTLRSKDIGTSWPFPRRCLQLCLKHGVKDLLPPFEPPDLVRAHRSTKRKRSEQLIDCIDNTTTPEANLVQEESLSSLDIVSGELQHEPHLLSNLSILEHSGQVHRSLPLKKKIEVNQKGLSVTSQNELILGEAETESTVSVQDHIESIPSPLGEQPHSDTISGSEAPVEPKIAKVPPLPGKIENTQKLSQKKCRLVVKLGAAPEPARTLEISSNSSVVSDSMASKVCPVCRTFSSTSNTTLNAHIDQCLSVESNTKRVMVKPFKHKVKPSKKRLMADIYATAACCTLEDLDRRNGTSWALDLSLVAPTNSVYAEVKRPKLCPVGPTDDENEGAVYIDSNGTKLCILSKLSTRPSVTVGESSKARTLGEEIEKPRKKFFGKKKRLAAKLSKHMKLKQQSKKSHSLRLLRHKIEVSPEAKASMVVDQEKEESIPQNSSVQDKITKGRSGTLRPKIRSLHSGKLNGEIGHSVSQNPLVETNKSDLGNSSAMESTPVKLSGPPIDFSPLKTKSMNILSSTVLERHKKEKEFNSLKLKLRTSSGGCSSSPRSKRVESFRHVVQRSCKVQKSDKVPCLAPRTSEGCHDVRPEDNKLISRNNPSLTQSSSLSAAADSYARNTHFASKKLRTHRPLKKSGKESSSVINGVPEGFDLVSASNYHVCVTNRSSCPMDIMTEGGNTSAQMSSGQSDCETGVKRMSLELSELEGECDNPDGTRDKPTERLADAYNAERSPLDSTAGDHANTNHVTSEEQIISYDASIHATSSLDENEKLIGGTEAWVELFAPRSSTNQPTYCGDESSNVIITPNIGMASQLEFSDRGKPCSRLQYIECQREDAVGGQVSNACLTSPRVGCLDVHQEHSCVTSNRTLTNDDHNMVIDRDSSGSPISAASTISHPTTGELKDTEPQTSARPAVTDDKSRLEFHDILDSPFSSRNLESIKNESKVQEPEAVAVAHDPVKTWDKQSYCCLHGESSPYEFLLSSKGNMEGIMAVPATSSFNSKPIEPSSLYSLRPRFRIETASIDPTSPTSALEAAVRYPTGRDFGSAEPSPQTQSQCSSNPVLRLMGKNLMVVNKEENMPLEKEPPCSSKNFLDAHYPPVFIHSSRGSIPDLSNHQFQSPKFIEGSRVMEYVPTNVHQVSPLPAGMQMSTFMGTTLQSGTKITDLQTRQTSFCQASDSPFTYSVENVAIHHQHQELSCATCPPSQPREVIVIDDSPNIEALPRGSQPSTARTFSSAFSGSSHVPLIPVSYIPSQYTCHHLRQLHHGAKPGFPVSCPGTNVHALVRGNPSETVSPLLSSQFVVPSLSISHLTPHVYSP